MEEEICVEDLTPQPERKHIPTPEAAAPAAKPTAVAREPEPEHDETQRLVAAVNRAMQLSPESARRKEDEEERLRNIMRREREEAERERDFQARAMEAALKSSSVKPPPTKKCPRCDKDTPISAFTCVHCGFSMMSGMFSF